MANDRDFVSERIKWRIFFWLIYAVDFIALLTLRLTATRCSNQLEHDFVGRSWLLPYPLTQRQYNNNGPCLLVIVSFSGNYFVAFCRIFIWCSVSYSLIAAVVVVVVMIFFLFLISPSISLWVYRCIIVFYSA